MKHQVIQTASRKYSTDALAAQFMVKPDSVRSAICRQGHYLGIRPIKLPNGRLAWPAAEVDRIVSGEAAQ